MKTRPTVLSIAGFDPSGGAGILSDVKTFEQNKTLGLGVISANTWQNESEFENVEWVSVEKILNQIEILFRKSKIDFVKIGLVQNAQSLLEITSFLKSKNPNIKIIWDPILKASTGFDFHSDSAKSDWLKVFENVYFITPNWNEALWLSGVEEGLKAGLELSKYTNVCLKGGHNPEKPGYDYIFTQGFQTSTFTCSFRPKGKNISPKHGSGCVFSSALTALMARGFPLKKAMLLAKEYVTRYLTSNTGLLGYHNF